MGDYKELIQTFKSLVGKFVWLHLKEEYSTKLPYGYGYISKVIDDGYVTFYAINRDYKVESQWLIHVSLILGACWNGEALNRIRYEANRVNFEAKKETITNATFD